MLLPLRAPPVINVIVAMRIIQAYTIALEVTKISRGGKERLTTRGAARNVFAAPGAREAG